MFNAQPDHVFVFYKNRLSPNKPVTRVKTIVKQACLPSLHCLFLYQCWMQALEGRTLIVAVWKWNSVLCFARYVTPAVQRSQLHNAFTLKSNCCKERRMWLQCPAGINVNFKETACKITEDMVSVPVLLVIIIIIINKLYLYRTTLKCSTKCFTC